MFENPGLFLVLACNFSKNDAWALYYQLLKNGLTMYRNSKTFTLTKKKIIMTLKFKVVMWLNDIGADYQNVEEASSF